MNDNPVVLKMNIIIILHVIITLLLIFTVTAKAGTILERRYTFPKLEELWKTGVGGSPPDESWFQELVIDGNNYQLTLDEVPTSSRGETSLAIDDELPFDGVIIGEDIRPSSPSTDKKMRAFPVIAIPAGQSAQIFKRLAHLEIYLNRYLDFAATGKESAEQLDALNRRFKSAIMESYLINLLLYFVEDTFEKKCLRLEKVKKWEDRGLKSWSEAEFISQWRPLYSLYQSAKRKFSQDFLRELVCKVRPTRSRGETEKMVRDQVRALIAEEVRKKVEETFVLLQEAAAKFQNLVSKMDVEIKTKEIMELDRVLGEVKANLLMVKNDQLQADELIKKLKQVDLTQLKNEGGKEDLKKAELASTEVQGKIVELLKILAPLADLSRDPTLSTHAASLQKCRELPSMYEKVDWDKDIVLIRTQFLSSLEKCLSTAKDVVQQKKKNSAQKELAAQMAQFLNQLSMSLLGDTSSP